MCPPALIIGGVVAATAVGSAVAQHNAQNKANKANAAAAREAFANAVSNANALRTESQDKAARSIFAATRQSKQARSQAAAAAGESGVAGRSAQAVIDQVAIDLGEFGVQTERNLGREISQIERDQGVSDAVKRQRIAAQPPANPWATGLNIVSGIAQGAGAAYGAR